MRSGLQSVRMWRTITAGLIALVLVACGSDSDDPDSGATLACRDFRDAASDQTDGLLTAEELRGRMQDVQSNARLSEESGIADAGRELLAQATAAGDNINTQGYADAVNRFGGLCEDLGI